MLKIGDIFNLPKGTILDIEYHDTGKFNTRELDTSEEGSFIVIRTQLIGGTPPGARDPWPNGWRITARKYNATERMTVRFYQSGCFINMLPDIIPFAHHKLCEKRKCPNCGTEYMD